MNKILTFFIGLCWIVTPCLGTIAPTEPTLHEGTIYDKTNLEGKLSSPESHWTGDGVEGTPDEMGMGFFKPFESNGFSFTYYWGDPAIWGSNWYMGYTYSNSTNTSLQAMDAQYTSVTGNGKTGNTYIIYYDDSMMGPGYETYISFKDGKAHQIKGTYITNNLWGYQYMTSEKPFNTTNKGWTKVTATGYDEEGQITGSLDFYLADFRTGDGYVINDWRWFELSQLGKVGKIRLKVSSSDIMAPAYCCLDGMIALSNEDTSQKGPRLNKLNLADLYMPSKNSYFTATEGEEDPNGDVNTWFSFNHFKFLNRASYGFSMWSGFTYSNVIDKNTAGLDNQYASITGGGISGKEGSSYLVGYYSEYGHKAPVVSFTDAKTHIVAGVYVTNSTYAYLSMKEGDSFSRKFSKENKDWFKLTATGYDAEGNKGKSIDFYLADFRNEDDKDNYIVNSWKWMDLSTLGQVARIEFSMASSDVNGSYMNTPSYFCMDEMAYITEEYPLPVYGEPKKAEGITYDTLNMEGMLSSPETSWLSSDSSTPDGYNFKTNFKQGAFSFGHYWAEWGFAGGFTYSNITDKQTADYTNLGAITAGGYAGDTYLIAKSDQFTPSIVSFEGNEEHDVLGAYITNSTYAYLSMKHGDSFAKKFGGESGRDADWFRLTAIGLNKNGEETARTDFYLADYRFFESGKDYAINEWKWFDLTPLGKVANVKFEVSSSDNGEYGMNTPAYFCMDHMIINHVELSLIENESVNEGKVYYHSGKLYFEGLTGYHVTIASISGAASSSFHINEGMANLPVQGEKGIYIVRASKDGKSISYKVIIK